MSSDTDELTSRNQYELSCADCSFETVLEGTVYDALDVAQEHREEYRNGFEEHFVDLELKQDAEE